MKLRDTPATEYELYLMRKHRAAGTAPPMPKWYKRATLPKCVLGRTTWPVTVPRLGTVHTDPRIGYSFPGGQVASLRAIYGAKPTPTCPDARLIDATDDTREYVARFCKLNNLT